MVKSGKEDPQDRDKHCFSFNILARKTLCLASTRPGRAPLWHFFSLVVGESSPLFRLKVG